ncbi:hypothetical protein, partial [Kingella oralis]|uniref:hypothetical protein n=1 Tax=Kingella oralis TaxID=505 RepID=UPI003D15E872
MAVFIVIPNHLAASALLVLSALDAAGLGAALGWAAGAAAPTVNSLLNLSTVFCPIPGTFFKSSTDLNAP